MLKKRWVKVCGTSQLARTSLKRWATDIRVDTDSLRGLEFDLEPGHTGFKELDCSLTGYLEDVGKTERFKARECIVERIEDLGNR